MFHCCHLLAPLSCTYALPSHLCSETTSDSPCTATCSHTGFLLSAAHLCHVLSCSLLNHHPHSQHSTVFSPMAHLLVALVGALPGTVLTPCSAPLVPVLGHIVPVFTNLHSCQIFLCQVPPSPLQTSAGPCFRQPPKRHCFESL